MHLTVILETEVVDEVEANAKVAIVKNKLTDHPEITVRASVNEPISGQ